MAVDGVIKEKKKKKKRKEDEVGATAEDGGTKNKSKYLHASVQTMIKTEQSCLKISEEEQDEYDAPEKRKKKKKKKIKEEKSKANDVFELCCDASVQTAVKTEGLEIDLPQKEKKKKKKIIKESEPLQENVIKINEDEEKIDEECLVKKKKKKKKKETKVEEEEEEEEIDVGHKKKKKKRKNMEDEEQNPELEDGEVKKTRTKTEANVKDERAEKQTEKKKKKTKEKNTDLTENTETLVKVDKEKKVKTKKEKLAPIEEEINVNTEKKSKKKKRRLENLDEGQRTQDDGTNAKTGNAIGKMMSSKHKKIKNIKLEVDDVTEMEELLDKNKSREKSDVVFLSAKSGNQDEVSIDQARRLALQREIDKESQPEPNLGQWSTAQFDSSDRQAKFMRLMGGFKKSSQPITGSSGQANMALGKEAQQTLQQGLLGEFESAQSRHLDFRNKGIGLGFTPPSNKKFAIDVNARNSMRFDD